LPVPTNGSGPAHGTDAIEDALDATARGLTCAKCKRPVGLCRPHRRIDDQPICLDCEPYVQRQWQETADEPDTESGYETGWDEGYSAGIRSAMDASYERGVMKRAADLRKELGSGAKLRELDTLALVTTEPPPLDWLADGVFCRGKLTLVGGREKRGKSLVQLLLAVRAASGGGEVAGIFVQSARVLLVDAENGEQEIHRRLRAMGLSAAHASNLVIVEARGFDLRTDLEQVAELASRHSIDLVLLDSFRSLWRGDERDEGQVAEALDPVRELAHDTGISYCLTHHAKKNGEEYRGSSAIGACVDWCVMLDRHGEDPDKTRRRLTNPLARIAPERPDRWLSIRSVGDDGPVSLEEGHPFEREHGTPVRDEVEAKIRVIVEEGCRGVDPVKGEYTPTPPSWSTADFARKLGRDEKDRTVREAANHLGELGVIHRNDDDRWQRSPKLEDGRAGR
jgi:hypothetical protein